MLPVQPNQSLSLHDVVTIQNIDDEDFTFEYDRSRGNYPYLIKSGQVARFPRFLANHAIKHLIDKVLNKKKIKTNNEAARADLHSKIFISEEVFQQERPKSEPEALKETVDKLNQPTDIEKVLNEKDEVDLTQETTPEPINRPQPTRQDLLEYAKDKVNMVLDKKTMEKLDKLTDEQLIEELGYPTD